jgi:hypothetical protein
MRGATASVAGSRGAVPKPTAGQHNFMLLGDGTWGAQPVAGLPSQTSNSGKLLTTDGTNAAWTTTGVLTSLTSPASTNLTLGLGTGGTALTLADTTLAATFAGAVTAGDVIKQTGNPSLSAAGATEAFVAHNTGYGAVLYGQGTTHDAALLDRNTNPRLSVTTAGAAVTGTLSTTGAATFAGAVTVSTGNLVIGTAGNGIDFSATAGTGTSELLNDYEEGTWTPSLAGSATAGTVAYSSQYGYYTKIGRLLYVWFDVEVSSFSGGTGGLTMTNLPFSNANITNFYPTFQPWFVAAAYASTYTTPTGSINANTSVLILYSTDDGHANFDTMKVNQIGRIAGYVVMQTN